MCHKYNTNVYRRDTIFVVVIFIVYPIQFVSLSHFFISVPPGIECYAIANVFWCLILRRIEFNVILKCQLKSLILNLKKKKKQNNKTGVTFSPNGKKAQIAQNNSFCGKFYSFFFVVLFLFFLFITKDRVLYAAKNRIQIKEQKLKKEWKK